MCLVGFLLFLDPPKAAGAATRCSGWPRCGIGIKIITGDNRHVAAHVARSVGLDAAALLTGEQIDAHEGRGAVAPRRATDAVRRGRPAAEGAHRARAAARAAMRWATSATASTTRRRCTPPTSASRWTRRWTWRARAPTSCCCAPTWTCCAAGVDGRPPHLRQHAQVHRHHHQRQLRQHGQHGAGHAAAALPAAGGQADPAQQLPVRPAVDRDRHRPRRRRAPRDRAALGRARGAPLHDRVRPDQLGLRPADLRAAAAGVRRRRGRRSRPPGSWSRC